MAWTLGPNHPDYGAATAPDELIPCGACGTPRVRGRRCYACLPLRWAREYDHCQNCKTTESHHAGHGLCKRCTDTRRLRSGYHRPSLDTRTFARPADQNGVVRCRRCAEPVEPGKQCALCRERKRARHLGRLTT